MRLATPLVALALAAASVAGCGEESSVTSGGSRTGTVGGEMEIPLDGTKAPAGASAKSCDAHAAETETLRATGISCGEARRVMHRWQRQGSCSTPPGASRAACTAASYRCLGTTTDRGIAVSCSRPGRSLAFLAKRH